MICYSKDDLKSLTQTKGASFVCVNDDGTYKIKCKCGTIISRNRASIIASNLRCKKCRYESQAEKQRYSDCELEAMVDETYDDGTQFVCSYYGTGGHRHVILRCSCGREFKAAFCKVTHRIKTQCRKCSNTPIVGHQRNTFHYVKTYIDKESNSGCKLLSTDYHNNKTKLEIKCKCGNIFFTSFDKFKTKRKQQCNECGAKGSKRGQYKAFDYETIKKEIEKCGYIKLLSDNYISSVSPLELKCQCGNIFVDNYRHIKDSDIIACPECRGTMSKGEIVISQILEKYHITYIQQYQFKDLTGPYHNIPLRFDFAIMDETRLVSLVEFDGMQHFYPVEYWGGEKAFETLKNHDNRKNDYCATNNIPLLRIHYNNLDKIESILINHLKSLNMLISCQD